MRRMVREKPAVAAAINWCASSNEKMIGVSTTTATNILRSTTDHVVRSRWKNLRANIPIVRALSEEMQVAKPRGETDRQASPLLPMPLIECHEPRIP